jgi:hypothetical protein
MSAIHRFAAMCLVALASVVATGTANAQPVSPAQSQVALNPQPLPPFVDERDWGFDEG